MKKSFIVVLGLAIIFAVGLSLFRSNSRPAQSVDSHSQRKSELPEYPKFRTLTFPSNQSLFQTTQEVKRLLIEETSKPFIVPEHSEFKLIDALTPASRTRLATISDLPGMDGWAARRPALQERLLTAVPEKSFDLRDSNHPRLGFLAYLLAYDQGRGVQLNTSAGEPALLFLPFDTYETRAFSFTPKGLVDRSFGQGCRIVDKLQGTAFFESLIRVIALGYVPEAFESLNAEEQGFLMDYAGIYIAESYKSIVRAELRNSAILESDTFSAMPMVRNLLLMSYLNGGGKILYAQSLKSSKSAPNTENSSQPKVAPAHCWFFFKSFSARAQAGRVRNEQILSSYMKEHHPEIYSRITEDPKNPDANLFEIIARNFQETAILPGDQLAAYIQFIRIINSEAKEISQKVEAVALEN